VVQTLIAAVLIALMHCWSEHWLSHPAHIIGTRGLTLCTPNTFGVHYQYQVYTRGTVVRIASPGWAIAVFRGVREETSDKSQASRSKMEQLREFVRTGKASETVERTRALVEEGVEAEAIMNQALIPAMDEVGDLFQRGEYFLPEMLVAARAMKQGLEVLSPGLAEAGIDPLGKVVMGTVKGDLHDIGKNIVIMSLEGAGFEVVDLGIDVAPDRFVEAVRAHRPAVVGLSALLTTTMRYMKDTVDAIRAAGLDVRIMIGGAPVRQEFADEIGADFYGFDSTAARDYARQEVAA
jgi:5-methyltetrahydrofolate--homocysteine methyltransferase